MSMALSIGSVSAQLMRGESAIPVAPKPTEVARQLELELIVEEMEDAGFEIDVEEGFEEEWEEDIWVASTDDDLDAIFIDPDEPGIVEDIYLTDVEEEEETWLEEVETGILEVSDEDLEIIGDSEGLDEDIELMAWYDSEEVEYESLMVVAGGNSWMDDDELVDPGWEEVMEQWEFEDMEFAMEEEDLDLMEDIFYAN